MMQSSDFWKEPAGARQVSKKLDHLQKTLSNWQTLEKEASEIFELADLNRDEPDPELEKNLRERLRKLSADFQKIRIEVFLSGKYDDHNALVSVHSGAGGTDAQDWAQILLRMYLRYCERMGYKAEILHETKGSEAGIKSAVLGISGPYAFGHFRSEAGVHRLVRLSPFNPAHTRETSFALVEVLPELETREEYKIDPKELKIETSTSRGAGGQSVNTTYSAVRITHIPTGIKVSIQNERSQHQNKARALKILQGKLAALDEEKRLDEKKKIRGEFHSAEWGNQIRSYVIHPYKMVKDHRTDFESHDPDGVFEGNLDDFVGAFLEYDRKNHSND